MSNHRRKQKQVSLYLDKWLKNMVEDHALSRGKTFSGLVRELLKKELGLEDDYKPKEVTITYLPDGTTIYGLNEEVAGGSK